MYAMPIKTNKEDSAIAPVFGHSKWFVVVDKETKKIEIFENIHQGIGIVQELLNRGVTTILTPHLGVKPFNIFEENGVEIYYSGDKRVLILEAIELYESNKLDRITPQTIQNYANHGKHHH